MDPLVVVMLRVLGDEVVEMLGPERREVVEALPLDRLNDLLGMRNEVRIHRLETTLF